MDKLKRDFYSQRSNARRRNIEWLLTFDEWKSWWGDDIAKRGVGPYNLQMQRLADSGPYALGNIRKGMPRQNAITKANMMRKRVTAQAAEQLSQKRDLTKPVAKDCLDDELSEDEAFISRNLGFSSSSAWARSTR